MRQILTVDVLKSDYKKKKNRAVGNILANNFQISSSATIRKRKVKFEGNHTHVFSSQCDALVPSLPILRETSYDAKGSLEIRIDLLLQGRKMFIKVQGDNPNLDITDDFLGNIIDK